MNSVAEIHFSGIFFLFRLNRIWYCLLAGFRINNSLYEIKHVSYTLFWKYFCIAVRVMIFFIYSLEFCMRYWYPTRLLKWIDKQTLVDRYLTFKRVKIEDVDDVRPIFLCLYRHGTFHYNTWNSSSDFWKITSFTQKCPASQNFFKLMSL